jgi:sporulation protein YabP
MEEKMVQGHGTHKLSLNQRKFAGITGVKDVISFDTNTVLLETELGMLTIKGKNLHVSRLSVEKGEVEMEGTVDSFVYAEAANFSKKRESILGRLFR